MSNTPPEVGRELRPDNDDPLDGEKLEDGMALALSGGGFKAATYHLGALIRLNELGVLYRLKRISSVSGGSITAGVQCPGAVITATRASFNPRVTGTSRLIFQVKLWRACLSIPETRIRATFVGPTARAVIRRTLERRARAFRL